MQGQIVIVASAAAVVSFIGYSTYAPTKFALRGLADTLRNELLGFGVSVTPTTPPVTSFVPRKIWLALDDWLTSICLTL